MDSVVMSWLFIGGPLVFLVLYWFGLRLWNKSVTWRLAERPARWLKMLHYTLLALTVLSAFLIGINDISFAGAWTTRIVIFGFLISGILIHPLSRWADKKTFLKFYFRLFSFFPVIVSGFFMLPFIGMVVVGSLCLRMMTPSSKIYYEDNHLRVQSTFVGVLGPPRLDVIEKNGLFEERLNKTHRSAADVDSVTVNRKANETIVTLYDVPFYEEDPLTSDTLRLREVN